MNTILVTGIGGNVGQGVLRIIKNSVYTVRLIGVNTSGISAGNYLCDEVYEVPEAQNNEYIQRMKYICSKEHVDLIIPCTDAETYYLALCSDELPLLSSSCKETAYIFYNKYETWKVLSKHHIPFAETYLPSEYTNEFSDYIVKPSAGRGSRNVYINPQHPENFSDEYIIQRRYIGKEITTAFYVTQKQKLLGFITFERTLTAGMTTQCHVVFDYDKQIEKIILQLMKHINIKGSCNIQSIVDKETYKIIPFEINGRISGTNSIRTHFGFQDVIYTLEENVFHKTLRKPKITKGSCLRYSADIIYPGKDLHDIKNNKDNFYLA